MKLQTRQMGEKVVGVDLTGDVRKNEPETFRIQFPWGIVEVTRATDSNPAQETDYWVHVYVNHPGSVNYFPPAADYFAGDGAIKDARLDQVDKNSSESNLGDFNRAELYHLAVRVGWAGRMDTARWKEEPRTKEKASQGTLL